MKKSMLLGAVVLLLCALLTASGSSAQTILNAVGSSAVFTTTGLAAVAPDPVTSGPALCGVNFWSGGSGSASSLAYGLDSRNAGIPHEPGTLWVAWDIDTAPTKVCTYLSVDSIVGDRLFLSQNGAGNATLNILATAQYTVGANKVAFVQDNTSCATSVGALVFNVDLSEASNTVTAVVHGGGNFSNYFANGATVTIASSPTAGYNLANVTIGGVGSLGPASFTYTDPNGGLGLDNSGTATATVVANCPGLPAAVYAAVNGTHFTQVFTDIRPEDAHFAFVRATCALNPLDPQTTCMGYSSNPASPTAIKSSYSQGVAVGLDFGLFGGTDPISSLGVPAGTIVDVGAIPIMYIANTTNVTACGLGNAAFTNVNLYDVINAYRGTTGATQDISGALAATIAGTCPTALHPIEREPLSGTYNTQEWQITRSQLGGGWKYSQENGNVGYPQSNNNLGAACPAWVTTLPPSAPSNVTFPPFGTGTLAPTCGNPLNIQTANYTTGTPLLGPYGGFGGQRTRAIGTGEVVTVVNSANAKDAFGYAFYSIGTFGGKANVKYVTLQGSDPLWPSYAANPYGPGVLPQCSGKVNLAVPSFSCTHAQPTFDGITTGHYLNWNVVRSAYYGAAATCPSPAVVSAACLVQAAQDQANPVNGNVRDYVPVVYCNNAACSAPVQNLTYFRAHYSVSGVTGHNGYTGAPWDACPALGESGGDVAGAILPITYEVAQLNSIGCTAETTGVYQ